MTRSSAKALREPLPDPEALFRRLAKLNLNSSGEENDYELKTATPPDIKTPRNSPIPTPKGTPNRTPTPTLPGSPPPTPRTIQRRQEEMDQAALEAMTMEERMKATRVGQGSAIVVPAIANDFEIKGQFLQMIINQCQFSGTQGEDANEHLRVFDRICDSFRFKFLTRTP